MFDFMGQSLERSKIEARRFAVLHHVLPVQELEVPRDGVPISLTVDAAELFGELQERRFDVILHFGISIDRSTSGAVDRCSRPRPKWHCRLTVSW